MRYSRLICYFFGIAIRVHASWPLAAAFITVAFAFVILPERFPLWGAGRLWSTGVSIALCLAVSVLAHEFAHVLVAQRLGIRASTITLFVFGGVSSMDDEATRPRTELLVSLAGPLTSLSLGLLGGLAITLTHAGGPGLDAALENAAMPVVILYYLALANLALGVFNLAPAFPLDGGRILSAALWAATGDRGGALRRASLIGQIGAGLLITYGAYHAMFGSLLSGVWIIGVGVFLMEATAGAGAIDGQIEAPWANEE